MLLMSTSIVLGDNLMFFKQKTALNSMFLHDSSKFVIQLSSKRSRLSGFISNAEKHNHSRKSSWWKKFFFDDDGNWLGLKEDDMLEGESDSSDSENISDGEKFEAWRQRAEAIIELREAQEDKSNEERRRWGDWLLDETNQDYISSWSQDWDNETKESEEKVRDDSNVASAEKGLVESLRYLILGGEDDDMLYEDRVFQYASSNSAKFLAVLIIIPWAIDFLVHDYMLMPFLDRYVKTVPLAAQMLDVRRHQKLQMIEELRTERGRFQLEVEIGKSPPLNDEEIWWELRQKALELRDEWRLENRRAFANIWSDMVYGITLFILLYFNQSKVALLKFTGYKIINNISDTGKAFLIILVTDIFLGYHSESGWQTLIEIIVEHYGLEVDQAAITIFVCLVPVIIDACVKLWLFKFLPRLSPRVANIFQEMKRH
ncbi:chloroplast envelope membrane protein isoform X1 [Prosopis cineraria]|uniref:chloroplast envelope membrane protein isoform X1 n=2 Tax=Prosopis cineraria TaxID=364024 RepID=UPI00240EDBA9|nr:chloroplast envelope membrane protein isoform X1 [Prosopis cineraria]XP_054786186.1 chloroplast envelope membrane protein isoform X1 [Prosopis cineraria]